MGDIDVEGNKNRVAGRDFIELNLPGKDVEEPITQQQRSMLWRLVEEINPARRLDRTHLRRLHRPQADSGSSPRPETNHARPPRP